MYNPETKETLKKMLEVSDINIKWNPMDEVYPGIFLGGVDAAKHVDDLRKLEITHIINACYSTCPIAIAHRSATGTTQKYYEDRGFKARFLGVPADDSEDFDISKYFDTSSGFINSALEANGKVLVHCLSCPGVSRSATLVFAYLMKYKYMRAVEAVETVRKTRNIYPNDGFLDLICELEKYGKK